MSNTTPFLQRLADWNQGMNDVPRRLLIIAAVALACYIAVQLFPFCWPFVLALVFASLMEPVARLLRKAFKRFKAARSIATLLCMLLLYGLITILFFTITDKLVRECISLARTLPDLARAFVNQLTVWATALYEDYAHLLPSDFIERVSGMLTSMVSNVASWAANITGWIASFTISTVSSLPMIILSVLFTIMATFYFSYDKERIAGFFRSQFPSQVVKDFRLIKGGVFTAIFGQVRAQIFISFVLINNTVRLNVFSRRFTIHTMRLVGATKSFIRAPFLVQAVFQGLFSALLATLMLVGILFFVRSEFAQLFEVFRLDMLLIVIGVEILAGVLICVVSTALVVGRLVSLSKDELYC